jgi:sugar lactone lactonase YvrE
MGYSPTHNSCHIQIKEGVLKKSPVFGFACLLSILLSSQVQGQTIPAGSWSPAGSLASSRSQAAATTLRDGRVLITGGVSGGAWLSGAEIYDGKSFTPVASMTVARSNHTAAVLSDGRVIVAGGYTSSGLPTSSIEVYDPTSNKWSVSSGMVQARAGHTMTTLNDGRLLIAGGIGSSGPLATLEIYDPASPSCTALTVSMSSPRIHHAAALLTSGAVLLAGGFDGSSVLNSVDAYDPKTGMMHGPRQMVSPRKNLSATTLIDGRVLLAGGNDGTQDLATLEVADLLAGTVSVVGSLSVARSGHVAITLPNNGDVLIAGGISSGTTISSAELFSPANSSVRSAGSMSVARSGAVAAGVGRSGHVLVAEGESSGSTSGDLYAFPTITTDKPEYAPNTVVKITGSGWTPGETVTLVLHEQPTGDPDVTLTAMANSSGSFQDSSFKPDIHDEKTNFILTAKGQESGVFAQTIFADSTYSTQLYSHSPTSGDAGGIVTAAATLQYGYPEYQIQYYYYSCNPYSCNCGWFGCDTCYNTCQGWYSQYIGTYYFSLAGEPVQFSFDNGSQVTAVTDSNGLASAPLIVPAGATSLTASFAGSTDGTFGPSTAVSNFTVTNLPLLMVAATNATGTYGQPLPPLTYAMTGFLNGDTQGSATTGAPSEGTAASPTSTPGMYPIAIGQGTLAAANYTFTFVNNVLTLQQAASAVAVTSLNSSVYLNQSTTLTATVSVTGSGAAPTGIVNFMAGAALLGTGAVSPTDATDSSATLTINGSQLTAGANNITAAYSGDPNYGASTSAAITVTLVIPQVDFGSVNTGTAAPMQTLTYDFTYPTTLAAVNILTAGISGLDYTDGGSSSCVAGTSYNAGQSCVITVAFTPSAPGLRSGGVMLFAQGYNTPINTWYLNGIGQSGAATIDPGTQTTIATLSNNGQGYGSAIDGAGDIYVVDYANSQVIKLTANTFTQSTVVASGLLNPTAVALDGAGNLYISDAGNSRVEMVPNEQGSLNTADMSMVSISGLGSPGGVATDGSGSLYVADATNGNVIQIPAGGGAPSTVASGLTSPQGVAVDALGNVYVASTHQVSEYPMGGGTPIPMGGGYNNPRGVAVDASGALYVADSGNGQIVRVAPGGASQASLAITGFTSPQGVTVDAAGNVYVTDSGSVYEVNRTQAAALAFGSTNVGSTSTPQTLTVSDAGNQQLIVSNIAITTNFTQVPSGGTDCTSITQLSTSAQCSVAVAFAPTISGTLPGTFTLSDNALNNAASTQAVQLSGNGTQVAQTITFPTIPTQTYGAGTVPLHATASSGLSVSYAVTSGPATVSGNTLTITGAGSVTVQASQAGNATYSAASPVSQTFGVSPAATTVAWSNPAAIIYGTALSATQLNATATPVSAGTYIYAPAAGTVLGAGSQTLSVTFTPSDSNYAPSSGSASLQVNPASQSITFPTIPTQTYGAAYPLNATASSGLSVNYAVTSGPAAVSGNTLIITGAGSVMVQASQAGNLNYSAAASVSQTFTVNKANQTITFTQPAPAVGPYNSSFSVAATASSALPVSFSSSGVCTSVGATFTMTNSIGTCTVTASQSGNSNYLAASPVTQSTSAAKAAQTVTFTGAPATARYHSTFTVAASSTSGIVPTIAASGACSVSGTLVTMTSGTGTCNMIAKWAANNYYLATAVSQTTTAQKVASTIIWPAPAAITYGTTLSATQLNATGNVAGSYVYSPAAGSVLKAGADTLKVMFTPTLSQDYTTVTASVVIQVNQAIPTINWPTPAAIAYGTPLSATQLDATANIPGSFVYSVAAGKVLNPGSHPLSVTFTPTDHTDYTKGTATVTLLVTKVDTSTTITSNLPNPSTTGKAVSVHFTVAPATTYTPPTGNVTISASTGESCTGKLYGGSGSCSVIFNSGARTLTATYAGDGNNNGSVSATVTQTVN